MDRQCQRDVDALRVPSHALASIRLWVSDGAPPGSFLTAVLRNDLKEALGKADMTNRYALYDIVFYLYNHCPKGCWVVLRMLRPGQSFTKDGDRKSMKVSMMQLPEIRREMKLIKQKAKLLLLRANQSDVKRGMKPRSVDWRYFAINRYWELERVLTERDPV